MLPLHCFKIFYAFWLLKQFWRAAFCGRTTLDSTGLSNSSTNVNGHFIQNHCCTYSYHYCHQIFIADIIINIKSYLTRIDIDKNE